ncbi:MAG: putative multiple sugar transport system permease protein, partial [Frankiales bacterium]|nr:putative multiple sugar transport system permease protein [Frankiales bacterium]
LDAIAAVFIGGAAVAGGVGTVLGSMIGGLVMGVLNLGLANLSVDSNFVQIIKGLVLLLAVAFDVRSKMQGRPSFIGMMMAAVGRGNARTAAAPVPVEVSSSLDGTDSSRSATPSGAPTVPEDLPPGLGDSDQPGDPVDSRT